MLDLLHTTVTGHGPLPANHEQGVEVLADLHARCVRTHEAASALVTGQAGQGKTALLQRFARNCEADGTPVLWAVAQRSERTVPFAVLEQLAASPALDCRIRAELYQALSPAAGGTPAADPASAPFATVADGVAPRVRRLVAELAERKPVVVIVDDIQHADRASLEVLLHLRRWLWRAPLLQVFAMQPELHPAHPDLRAQLERICTGTRIRLERYDAAQVCRKVAESEDPDRKYSQARDLFDISRGNPAMLDALLADLRTEQCLPGTEFASAVAEWVHSQDPALVRVAAVLATGAVTDRAMTAKASGLESSAVDLALALLADTGLAGPEGALHPAVGEAVLRALPAERRVRIHLDVAKVLHEEGAPVNNVVAQLTAAGQAPDEWMFTVLWAAADQALVLGQLDTAAELLRLARLGPVSDRQRARALAGLAQIEWRNNPAATRRHLDELTTGACQGHLEDTELAVVVKYLLWHGRFVQADRVLDYWCSAVAGGERLMSDELRKTVRWLQLMFPLSYRRLPRNTTDGLADERPAATLQLVGLQTLHGVRNDELGARRTAGDAEQVLRQAWPVDDSLTSSLEPAQAAVMALFRVGRLDLAAARCEELLSQLGTLHSDTWRATAHSVRSEIAVRRGEPQVAIAHSGRALDLLPSKSWGVVFGIPASSLVIGLSQAGRHAEAAKVLWMTVPDCMFDSQPGLLFLHSRAVSALERGRWEDALRDYENCGRLMREWGIESAGVEWRTGAAMAQLRLGRADLAVERAREVLADPNAGQGCVRGVALRVMAETKEPGRRLPLLSEAVDVLEGESGSKLELGRALLDLSRASSLLGDTAHARLLANRARRQLNDVVAPPSTGPAPADPVAAVAKLSEAERRVARLAAEGRTNRAVAEALFISVGTVEQHLTRIYRKLGITRRRDLVAGFHNALVSAETGLAAPSTP